MRFYYLTTGVIYPHDVHLIEGLRQLGHEVIEIHAAEGRSAIRQTAKKLRARMKGAGKAEARAEKANDASKTSNAIIVGFTSPLLVFAARLATIMPPFSLSWLRMKVIFNAASSQYEANIISRSADKPFSPRAIRWWLLDFFSFHLSSKVLLESNAQREFCQKLFLLSGTKSVRSFSGISEKEFFYDPSVPKRTDFTVLFRGRFLPESGILTVIEAAKKLENGGVRFLIIGHGLLYKEVNALMDRLKPTNVEMLTEILPIDELRTKMLSCQVSLGQLADHPRLERTLPCKLFESLALKLPYLTGRNKAALELLDDGKTCITVNPGDADDLVKKILDLKHDQHKAARIGKAGFELYKQKLTSKGLAEEMMADCFK